MAILPAWKFHPEYRQHGNVRLLRKEKTATALTLSHGNRPANTMANLHFMLHCTDTLQL